MGACLIHPRAKRESDEVTGYEGERALTSQFSNKWADR